MSSAIERADGLRNLYGELGKTNAELIIQLMSIYKSNPSASTLEKIAGKLPIGYVTSINLTQLLQNDDGSLPSAKDLIDHVCDRDSLVDKFRDIMRKNQV